MLITIICSLKAWNRLQLDKTDDEDSEAQNCL